MPKGAFADFPAQATTLAVAARIAASDMEILPAVGRRDDAVGFGVRDRGVIGGGLGVRCRGLPGGARQGAILRVLCWRG